MPRYQKLFVESKKAVDQWLDTFRTALYGEAGIDRLTIELDTFINLRGFRLNLSIRFVFAVEKDYLKEKPDGVPFSTRHYLTIGNYTRYLTLISL
jgi:hypothetical protein